MGILNQSDYIKILNYYGIAFSPKDSSKTIKNKAETILAEKLCKCIKKVKKSDSEDTGVMTTTINPKVNQKQSQYVQTPFLKKKDLNEDYLIVRKIQNL